MNITEVINRPDEVRFIGEVVIRKDRLQFETEDEMSRSVKHDRLQFETEDGILKSIKHVWRYDPDFALLENCEITISNGLVTVNSCGRPLLRQVENGNYRMSTHQYQYAKPFAQGQIMTINGKLYSYEDKKGSYLYFRKLD
jgi:hypothetical protein